jgi:DNA topoisomerase-1
MTPLSPKDGGAVNLFIVESPAKAKTFQKYLGPDFKVLASIGHIRDLPAGELGVDVATFSPTYVVLEAKRAALKAIQDAVKDAAEVYLATDPDREGEAIAWHLSEVLKLRHPDAPATTR